MVSVPPTPRKTGLLSSFPVERRKEAVYFIPGICYGFVNEIKTKGKFKKKIVSWLTG
jgi:hypothetical protein